MYTRMNKEFLILTISQLVIPLQNRGLLPAVMINGIGDLINSHLMPIIETDPYSDFV